MPNKGKIAESPKENDQTPLPSISHLFFFQRHMKKKKKEA